MSDEAWLGVAEAWARWVRGPAGLRYEPFSQALLEVLPAPSGLAVDLGCGEGVVTRLLAEGGYEIVGVDIAPTAVRIAAEADPKSRYVVGDMTALPFDDETFDLAVARLSLQDVDDLDGAVDEVARILRRGGKLCFSVFHPVRAGGRWVGEQFVVDDYFGDRPWVTTHDADGLPLTIHSHHRGLRAYTRALSNAGLLIEAIVEAPGEDHETVPLVLALRARKA
jgi:SAM-dependent methyltransferase